MQRVLISPKIMAIEDLVTSYSKLNVPDSLTLLMELWKVYRPIAEEQEINTSLDAFFPLGETLLKDFNAVDQQLAKSEALFANVAELRELEERFEPKEQIEELQQFWAQFSDREVSEMKREFRKLWQEMGRLYTSFRANLSQKGWAYQGMAAKKLAYDDDQLAKIAEHPLIVICGFNAIPTVEARIFDKLKERTNVKYFFDSDRFYQDQAHHEAGKYMRQNKFRFQNSITASETLANDPKDISVTGVSGIMGMAQVLAEKVSHLEAANINEKTAIVLADEQALQPVLNALPDEISPLNITMGYPLRNSPYSALLFLLTQTHVRAQGEGDKTAFYYRDVLKILRNPVLKGNEASKELGIAIERKNMVYITSDWLKESTEAPFPTIFSPVRNAVELLNLSKEVLRYLSQLEAEEGVSSQMLIGIFRQLNRLGDLIASYHPTMDLDVYYRLLRRVVHSTRIPFEGEPLSGVQVMGFLETRSLDFDRVYVLSMNEGIMPKGVHYNSLIPFGIRKNFHLDTFQEDDAIYAYHFYRLLHSAKQVELIYNTDSHSFNKGEASRYVLQLEYELCRENPNISWTNETVGFSPKLYKTPEFSVPKTEEVLASLAQYEVREDGLPNRPLSPSALVTYLKSPLQFYYRYVANLKERNEVLEDMDAITLGHIVHSTLEELYKPHLNKLIVPKLIDHFKKDLLEKELESQLRDKLNVGKGSLKGRNILLFNVCKKLCENVLNTDAKTEGLHILKVEFDELAFPVEISTTKGPKKIMLQGQFDRLDEVKGVLRVVDYKTGKVEIPRNENAIFSDAKNAAAFQALFYTYVYLSHYPDRQVQPVIFHLKSTSDLVKPVKEGPVTVNDLNWFEENLKILLAEIWNADLPFAMKNPEKEVPFLMVKPLL